MASLVILAVSNGGEALLAVLALVRLLTGVGSHVYEKVSFLREDLPAVGFSALEQVLPRVSRLDVEFKS
jgi:hypothetical protein